MYRIVAIKKKKSVKFFHLFRAKSLSKVEYNTRLKTHNTGDITGPIPLLLQLDAPKVFLCLFFIKFNRRLVGEGVKQSNFNHSIVYNLSE